MKPETRIRRRMAEGYVKPTRREFDFLRRNEGLWTVKTVHLGLYGEERESKPYRDYRELRKRAVFMGATPFVLRYV